MMFEDSCSVPIELVGHWGALGETVEWSFVLRTSTHRWSNQSILRRSSNTILKCLAVDMRNSQSPEEKRDP